MRTPRTALRAALALVVASAALALPAASQAASPLAIIIDCERDGKLDKDYSNRDLRKAKDELTGDQAEYSDCLEVLSAAIDNPKAKASGGASAPGETAAPPSADPATAAKDNEALDSATGKAAKPEAAKRPAPSVTGEKRAIGTAGGSGAPPAPVLILLAAAALAGLGAGIYRTLHHRAPRGQV